MVWISLDSLARAVTVLFNATAVASAHAGTHAKTVISSDGTLIYADATGDYNKPHVVMVHGYQLASPVFDALVADEKLLDVAYLVRYDLRGHGRSGKPTDSESYRSARYAADYEAVARSFGLYKPIFIGWGLGAATAVDIGGNISPNPLAGIVYINALPSLAHVGSVATSAAFGIIPRLAMVDDVASSKATTIKFVDMLFARPKEIPWALKSSWIGMTAQQSPAVSALVLGRTQDASAFSREGQQGLPRLVIYGTDDTLINGTSTVAVMRPLFHQMTVEKIEGGSHSVFLDHKEQTVSAITAFVRKINPQLPSFQSGYANDALDVEF